MTNNFASLLFMSVLSLSIAGVPHAAAQEAQPTILWTQLAGFQPVDLEAGDLNGDSRPDVAVGYSENAILAVDSTGAVLWRFTTDEWVWSVAVGDLDGDGRDDVVAIDRHEYPHVYAISGSGVELWRQVVPAGVAMTVKVADVTGDVRNEVVYVSTTSTFSTVTVLNNQGVSVSNHTLQSRIQSIDLGNINGTPHREIVISYSQPSLSQCPCGVEVIDGSGQVLWNFSTPMAIGALAAGDINQDEKADVVAGESGPGARKVYAIDSSGALLWEFDQGQGGLGQGATAVALGDLDGDSRLDVVVGSLDQHVYGIRSDGQVLWAFAAASNISQLAVGDLDGNGSNEVAAATMVGSRAGVYALDAHGNQLWFFPKTGSDVECPDQECVQGFRDLVIADVDADGRSEVVAIQDELTYRGEHGLVFALSTPEAHLTVAIDIKPGGGPNTINSRSHGKIPVAILSSTTFDASTELNTASITFGRTGNEPSLAFCHPGRVNGDRLTDVVCHFDTDATGLTSGDTHGVLKGETWSGVPIQGVDAVCIVK